MAVDGVITPNGLLFGLDNLYLPARPSITLLQRDGVQVDLAPLPSPSYSVHALPAGGYLLGVTRERDGDVYPEGDVSARLYGSADGSRWSELLAFPRLQPDASVRADVYWHLPSGDALLQLENAARMAPGGHGFLILRPRLE